MKKKQSLRPSAVKTREKLLAAGRKAFAAKGLGGASLREDILAPSGISAGSFYHQFADKAELLAEIIRSDGERVLKALDAAAPEGASADPAGRGLALLGRLFDRAEKNPHFIKIFVREYYSESALVRRVIRQHKARTTAGLQRFYDELAAAMALPLDTETIATILSNQSFAVLNHYVGLSRPQRAALRSKLLHGMLAMTIGGVTAVRLPEGAARPATTIEPPAPAAATAGEGAAR